MLKIIQHLPFALLDGKPTHDTLLLTHDERVVRRKVLTTQKGLDILIDNEKLVTYHAGDGLLLENGQIIVIKAADESLLQIASPNPLRLMEAIWHIGNRHTPCMIEEHTFYIEQDSVLEAMLKARGLEVKAVFKPFHPQKGAYHSH